MAAKRHEGKGEVFLTESDHAIVSPHNELERAMEEWWTQKLTNGRALEGLYDEEPPLEDFELRELRVAERGLSWEIRGELSRFPDHPRPDWDEAASRLEIQLRLSMIEGFKASGLGPGGLVELVIARAEDGLSVKVEGRGDEFQFEVVGMSLQMIGIRAL